MKTIAEICADKEFVTEAKYMEVIKPSMTLAISRNKKYGSSVEIMDDTSIIDLVMMKLIRTKNMIKDNEANGVYDPKIYDELYDGINFLVYIGIRLNNRGHDMKPTQGTHN